MWEPEVLRVLFELGNETVNQIYEACVPDDNDIERATENCERNKREAWIRAKYIERKFVLPLLFGLPSVSSNREVPDKWSVQKTRRRSGTRRRIRVEIDEDKDLDSTSSQRSDILIIGEKFATSRSTENTLIRHSDQESTSGEEDLLDQEEIEKLNPNFLLYKAALAHNIPVMCQSLALGAEKNWENPADFNRTALHQAILSASLMATEFLLLNGANINCIDRNGDTPLHLATEKGFTQLAYLLLKHKAKHDLQNKDGKEPIDIAVEQVK